MSKEQIISQILSNPHYLPDAKLIQDLAKALSGMSRIQLGNLLLIVNLKSGKPVQGFSQLTGKPI
jgi:hypothetical protein